MFQAHTNKHDDFSLAPMPCKTRATVVLAKLRVSLLKPIFCFLCQDYLHLHPTPMAQPSTLQKALAILAAASLPQPRDAGEEVDRDFILVGETIRTLSVYDAD